MVGRHLTRETCDAARTCWPPRRMTMLTDSDVHWLGAKSEEAGRATHVATRKRAVLKPTPAWTLRAQLAEHIEREAWHRLKRYGESIQNQANRLLGRVADTHSVLVTKRQDLTAAPGL